MKCLAAYLLLASPVAYAKLHIFPGAGYDISAYAPLRALLAKVLPLSGPDLCLAHSDAGMASLFASVKTSPHQCAGGAVLLGAAPSLNQFDQFAPRTLLISGSRDGVTRFSSFAALSHAHRHDERR